jgi:flavodoxin/ferredoxin
MKIGIFYFSATGVTEIISNHIKEELIKEGNSVESYNIITIDQRQNKFNFLEFDGCIFGFPVFGGRAPSVAEEWITTLDGGNQTCTMFFTYGARDLEWAHQTTYFLLSKANFKVALSAEFIGRHSFNVGEGFSLAEDRPNKSDFDVATDFAILSLERFQNKWEFSIDISSFTYEPVKVREKTGDLAKFYPSRYNENCIMCNLCEDECPVNAFDAISGETDRKLCITCMHCIIICPDHVLKIGEVSEIFINFMHRTKLTKNIVDNKQSKIKF